MNNENNNGRPSAPPLYHQDDDLHNHSSFVDTFHAPPPSQPTNNAPQNSKKAKRRRKRHVPPGPAGVWFQSQLHNTAAAAAVDGAITSNAASIREDKTGAAAAPDVSSCPAWMCMQHSLGICTPYLPPYLSIKERHQHLRSVYGTEYLLLPELVNTSQNMLQGKKLLVLVHKAAVQYHSYWTVELRDECGASLKAWMDPELPDEICNSLIQMGVVWLLRNLKILVDSVTKQQWLLISQNCIEKVWTPQQATREFSDEQYLQWMTKRSTLSTTTMSSVQQQQQQDMQEETTRRMHQDDEEEDDASVIMRGRNNIVASVAVTPHPSNTTRGSIQHEPLSSSVVPQVSSGDSRRVSMDSTAAGGGRRRRADDTNSRTQHQRSAESSAVTFTQFLSPPKPSNATTAVPKKTAPSVSNPYGSKTRPQQQQQGSGANQTPGSWQAHASESATTVAKGPRQSNETTTHHSSSSPVPPSSSRPLPDFSQFRSPTSSEATKSRQGSATSTTTATSNSSFQQKQVAKDAQTASLAPAESTSHSSAQYQRPATGSRASKVPKQTPPPSAAAASKSRSNTASAASRPSMSMLAQFSAVSATEVAVLQSSTAPETRSPKNSSAATKRQKSKTLPKTSSTQSKKKPRKSPKSQKTTSVQEPASSNLWLGASDMMSMLDEDDDDDEQQSQQAPLAPVVDENAAPPQLKESDVSIEPSQQDETNATQQEASSLFQASAFAGIDMDNLFDEDD